MIRRLVGAWVLVHAAAARAGDGSSRDAVLHVRDQVFARPEYALHKPEGPSILEELFGGTIRFLEDFHARYPRAYLVFLGLLLLALLVLVAHIAWTLTMARRARFGQDLEAPDLDLRVANADEFRERAVRLAREGRHEEAVRELYTALLVTLDRRGDVSWARHKALLDYRLEARADDACAALAAFAGGYHPTSFGRRPLPDDRFAELLAHVDGLRPRGSRA